MGNVEYQLAVRDLVTGGVKLTKKPTPTPPYAGKCYCSLAWYERTERTKWVARNENLYGKSIRKFCQCDCKGG